MSVAGWIMLFAHLGLFLYLRTKYIGKKKKAEKRASEMELENITLRSKVKDYEYLLKNGD